MSGHEGLQYRASPVDCGERHALCGHGEDDTASRELQVALTQNH